MFIFYFIEIYVKNNMWFGNVFLIFGIIGVVFLGIYI